MELCEGLAVLVGVCGGVGIVTMIVKGFISFNEKEQIRKGPGTE